MAEEDVKKLWYAVMQDREDLDWGYGAFDVKEAKEMLKNMLEDHPAAYIVLIDAKYDEYGNATREPMAIDEITREDLNL